MIVTGTLEYRNERSSTRAIQIEPWAEEFFLQPESMLRLEIACERPGAFEVWEYDETTAIWAWTACTARVFIDGVEHTTPFMGKAFPA